MLGIRIFSMTAVIVMLTVIVYGFLTGDFTEEGSEILGLAWGRVTLVDLYVGLAIFGLWVGFREHSPVGVGLWWILLIGLGNLAAALYLAVAAFRSSSPRELLLGPGQ